VAQFDSLQTVDVTAIEAYPVTPQVVLAFTADSLILMDEHATARIYISYNGTVDHRVLIPNTPLWALAEERQVQKVWIRREAGAFVGTVSCVVEASGAD
jgi:hypothetical protein